MLTARTIHYEPGATNGEGTIHINPQVQYQQPVRLFSTPDKDVYINIVGGTGYTYLPGKGNASVRTSDFGGYETVKSPSLHYIPVTLGIYGTGVFAPGVEVSSWKGLGQSDNFSMKLLSLRLNIKKIKMGAAYEIAALLSGQPAPTQIISFSLLYNVWRREQ